MTVRHTVMASCDGELCPTTVALDTVQPYHELQRKGWTVETDASEILTYCPGHSVPEGPDMCTWINPLCPGDLCVLPYDHRNADKGHHLAGTSYGSAHTSPEEQDELLKKKDTRWFYKDRAPRGTPSEELFRLGVEKARELFGDD